MVVWDCPAGGDSVPEISSRMRVLHREEGVSFVLAFVFIIKQDDFNPDWISLKYLTT